jgi:hypothetical protein
MATEREIMVLAEEADEAWAALDDAAMTWARKRRTKIELMEAARRCVAAHRALDEARNPMRTLP